MQRIALLLVDGVRLFDVSVVTEVFRNDRLPEGSPELFDLRTCGPGARPVRLEHDALLTPRQGLSWLANADLVIMPGVTTPNHAFPSRCSKRCARPAGAAPRSPRSASAPSCSPRPGCSTAAGR